MMLLLPLQMLVSCFVIKENRGQVEGDYPFQFSTVLSFEKLKVRLDNSSKH